MCVCLFFLFWGGGQVLITVLILKARPAETTSMTGVCMCVLHHLFEDHAFVCVLCAGLMLRVKQELQKLLSITGAYAVLNTEIVKWCIFSPEYFIKECILCFCCCCCFLSELCPW